MDRLKETLGSPRGKDWLFGVALLAASLIAYAPALNGQFIWDDDSWTLKAEGVLRDLPGLAAIWFKATALQQYYPLTASTFWLDYHLWGWRTLPYHLENVLLHVLGALLLLKLLRRLEVPGARLATIIFALHPVMVESVAWITERKNVLSLPLFLGSVMAYLRYSERSSQSSERFQPSTLAPRPDADSQLSTLNPQLFYYWLALFLFVAAYLAKASAFCLPAVLLLIVWWKRGRIRRSDLVPTLPFFALSIGLSMVTVWVEHHHTGASGKEWAFSFWERCLIAGRALWFYPMKLLWPLKLCFVYPRWVLDVKSLSQWCYPVSAAAVILALLLAHRKIGRGPVTAVLFYAGTLFPVLGFINGFGMRYSFVWDHWAYLSDVGLIALGAAVAVKLGEKFLPEMKTAEAVGQSAAPGATRLKWVVNTRLLASAATSLLAVLLAALTWQQSKMYKDMETLWVTSLARNPDATMAHNNYGLVLVGQGQLDQALAEFQTAERLRPDDEETQDNLANVLLQKGQMDEAMKHFHRALELKPDSALTHCNLALALLQQGKPDEAAEHFRKAVELHPEYSQARNNLGWLLLQKGKVDEAIEQFRKTLEYNPAYAEAEYNLGNAMLHKLQVDDAIRHFQRAIQINPGYAEAHYNLGIAWYQKGRVDGTIAEFQKVLQLRPDFAPARQNLAALLAQVRTNSVQK